MAIVLFAVAILTVSLKTQSVSAQEASVHMTQMHDSKSPADHMNSLSLDTKQQINTMMKQHHGNDIQECSHLNDTVSKET